MIEGRRPTFIPHQIERTHSLSSIFHPDHLIRQRHPALQERSNSLQNDSLDCPSYIVDLHFRGLVKYRKKSQIPPPAWRGPPKQEKSHIPPKTPQYTFNFLNQSLIHTNLYIFPTKLGETPIQENTHQQGVDIHPGPALRKAHSLEYLDVEAAGGPESREHSLVKFSGTTLPGPAHSLKSSTALKDSPACGGPDSRDRSTAKPFRGVDSSIAHRSTHRVANKDNPARGGPDSRDHSTAHPSGLTNPSDPTEGDPPEEESDHPPKTPPVPTSQGKSERLEAKLTPLQKRRLKTIKEREKTTKVPSSLPTLDTSSEKLPKKSKETHLPLLLTLE